MCCVFKDMPWGAVLAGTGHRPDKLGGYAPSPLQAAVRDAVRLRLLHYRHTHGLRGIYTGGALGFDTWWWEEALNLSVPVVVVKPFRGQELRWPAASQKRFRELCARSTAIIELHTTKPPNYRVACDWMWERDDWMVTNAWGLVACYNGDLSGGTAHTVKTAMRMQRPIDRLNPNALLAA